LRWTLFRRRYFWFSHPVIWVYFDVSIGNLRKESLYYSLWFYNCVHHCGTIKSALKSISICSLISFVNPPTLWHYKSLDFITLYFFCVFTMNLNITTHNSSIQYLPVWFGSVGGVFSVSWNWKFLYNTDEIKSSCV
jgi:hypothetical protein